MFEKFKSESLETFAQRYQGTYGFFREKDNRVLVRITEVNGIGCMFQNSKGTKYELRPDSKEIVGFEFIPPKASWYNCQDMAYLVRRMAAHQFSRGISDRNTVIKVLKDKLWNVGVGFDSLEAIYLKSVTPNDAFQEFGKRPSIAISPQFALSKDSLYLWDKKIGTFVKTDSHFTFKVDEADLFRTEITDSIKALGCTAEVIKNG